MSWVVEDLLFDVLDEEVFAALQSLLVPFNSMPSQSSLNKPSPKSSKS